MQLTPFQKIDIWAKVMRAEHKIHKYSKALTRKIPLTIRRDYYIKTVVKAHKKYHELLARYINKHNLY